MALIPAIATNVPRARVAQDVEPQLGLTFCIRFFHSGAAAPQLSFIECPNLN